MIPFESGQATWSWWRALRPDEKGLWRPGTRAALARLRHCDTIAAAMQEPACIQLFRRIREAAGPDAPRLTSEDLPAVALTAAVLAHVREDLGRLPGGVARRIGPAIPDDPSTALLKPLRFRRLMETAAIDGVSSDELLAAFRRLVALAGGTLPVNDLSVSLLEWCDIRLGERRRRRWIYDYWDAGSPPVTPLPAGPAPAATPLIEDARG